MFSVLVFSILVRQLRVARLRSQPRCTRIDPVDSLQDIGLFTVDDMHAFVFDLAFRMQKRATVPTAESDKEFSHVWDSPSGKRVYVN